MLSYTPSNMEELQQSLSCLTKDSKLIGGGTDLIIRLNMGICKPDALCYLGYIKELKEIKWEGDRLSIGAYATMTQMQNHPDIQKYFPALVDAASDVGSLQIRNNGTIGGNIGNASPAGDLIPVMYLYDAMIEITGPEGVREAAIDQVIERPGRTTLACNEAITRILLPRPSFISSFVKLGFRKKVTIARIGVALGIEMDGDYVKEMRFVAGAISLKPVRLTKAEEFIKGKALNEQIVMDVAQMLSDLIMEITPKEFDRDYKVFASRGVVMDAFKRLGQNR
ncbi:MAG: FAD binding domain-containing protein [Lachnospiraceae bacterium]|nr:FAD binding domain-containing protein [Lachnospiraceae bacterium]